jgi:hypothetical protein
VKKRLLGVMDIMRGTYFGENIYLKEIVFFLTLRKQMPPKAENTYVSFSEKKITCDNVLSVTASIVSISCIIAYFVYLAMR